MKTLFSFILSLLLTASVYAGTVRITLNGNRNFVVMVDGRIYNPNTTSGNKKQILITNLQNGQHEIEILRPLANGGNREIYSSSFNLGTNELVDITVNGNGRVRIEETTDNAAYDDSYQGSTS